MIKGFIECTVEYIPWEQNSKADRLSKLASPKIVANNSSVIHKEVEEPSKFKASHFTMWSVEQGHNWQQPILEYLLAGKILEYEKEDKKLKRS